MYEGLKQSMLSFGRRLRINFIDFAGRLRRDCLAGMELVISRRRRIYRADEQLKMTGAR